MGTHQPLPNRSFTGGSNMTDDEDAVPDYDPQSTTGLLLERLQAWKHMCGFLETYIGAVAKNEKSQAHDQEKILKTVSEPLKEGHHFQQSLGGVAGLFENMRSNTQGIANLHLETQKNLTGTVLPTLERLHAEIKNKNKELHNGADKGSRSVDKARNETQKYIELLGQHTANFDSTGGRIDSAKDPYLIQRGIRHRLNKQVLEENNNRQDLIAVQNQFQQFEAHILQTVQSALSQFLQFMGGQADRHRAMYGDIVSTAQNIPLDFEWNGFTSRNGALMVDPHASNRTAGNLTFPNQGHRATKPLIEGSLDRKSRGMGALKGYSSGYYAVTASGYLHEFKDDDDLRRDPTPEHSLYLPDCTVGAVEGTAFRIKGKDVSGGKMGAKLALNSEFAFKAHTPQDAQQWHSIIAAQAGQVTGSAPNSAPGSPVMEKNVSAFEQQQPQYSQQQQAYAQPQPQGLQTQGVASNDMAAKETLHMNTGVNPNSGATMSPQSAGTTGGGRAGMLSSPQSAGTTGTTGQGSHFMTRPGGTGGSVEDRKYVQQ